MTRTEIGAKLLLVLASLVAGFIVSEAAAQIYISKIAKQGKLFQPDELLGWLPLPNLTLERLNPDGEPWRIVTDGGSMRGPSTWQPGKTRVLMVGDSFVFGEGVDLEERLDSLLAKAMPDLSTVNIGVMGYDPVQQLLRARHWRDGLRPGDLLLLVTYGNDFLDIAKTRHSGRSKPWIEDDNGNLVVHEPEFDLMDFVRNHSFVLYLLARELTPGTSDETEERLESAGELYQRWVLDETRALRARGVRVVVVHHGDRQFELPFDVDATYASLCSQVSGCLALDPSFGALPRDAVFLEDGHWNAGGHRLAAAQIARYLRSHPRPASGPRTAAQTRD